MYYPSTARWLGTTFVGLAIVLVLMALAGPGKAAQVTEPGSSCPTTCIDAAGTFGPTVPVSFDLESADRLAAVIAGDSGQERPVTMELFSVEEGTEVEVLSHDRRIATVRLSTGPAAGRIGYVPTAWVTGS